MPLSPTVLLMRPDERPRFDLLPWQLADRWAGRLSRAGCGQKSRAFETASRFAFYGHKYLHILLQWLCAHVTREIGKTRAIVNVEKPRAIEVDDGGDGGIVEGLDRRAGGCREWGLRVQPSQAEGKDKAQD